MSTMIILLLALLIVLIVMTLMIWSKLAKLQNDSSNGILKEWITSNQADIKSELKHLQQTFTSNQSHLNQTLSESDKHLTSTLQKSYEELHRRMDAATRAMNDLKEETGKFSEIGRSMKDLQQFLRSPKLRGSIGEHILQELLSQMLPRQAFRLQYRFDTGDIVDALVITQAGKIPIDAKFPLENYTKMVEAEDENTLSAFRLSFIRDVKKHIKDISGKYIRTDEATVDFAVMYIPSEAIYYEIMSGSPALYDYAQQQRILPVSPATFYAFLRTILMSYEGQKIAAEAQAVIRSLRDIQKSSFEFGEKLKVLQRHLTNAHNNMQQIGHEFDSLQGKIDRTQSLGNDVVTKLDS